jgi:hypothetical protein
MMHIYPNFPYHIFIETIGIMLFVVIFINYKIYYMNKKNENY